MSSTRNIDRSFSWLGRFPLAVDFADTVRVVGSEEVELLSDEESLGRWVDAEIPHSPLADAARGHLGEVRRLRDSVRNVLRAVAQEDALPSRDLDVVNEAAARSASYRRATEDGTVGTVELSQDRFDQFCAAVARSTFQVLEGAVASLEICHAPSCGMLFVPANRRQRWCSPTCGNRARVARHAGRSKPSL